MGNIERDELIERAYQGMANWRDNATDWKRQRDEAEAEVVALRDQLAGAVEDRDHFERALERIFHGSEDHAWEDARKALDTRPSRLGEQ